MRIHASLALLVALLTSRSAVAQRNAPPEPVPFTVPFTATPGSTTKVAFHIAPGIAAPGFWSTFPIKAEPIEAKQPNVARFRLSVPADATPGIGALRFMTTTGVSSPRLFLIDDIPTTDRAENNTTPKTAQPLTLPAAVESDAEPLAVHYYRFTAARGQRVAFEVVAQRVGSRMDPVVRLLDPAGRELAYADDTPGLGADVRFAHTFTTDGDYLIEVRDAEYQGGPERRYRLRVGDFPAVTTPFPPPAARGATTPIEFVSPTGEHLGPIPVTIPKNAPAQISIPLKLPGGQTSAFVPLLCTDSADTYAGRFTKPGQRDVFHIDGRKGQSLNVRARTRGVQSAANVFLQLLGPDGAKLAESKPSEGKNAEAKPLDGDDGTLAADLPADGAYSLVVTELTGAAGPALVYRLDVADNAPFALTVETDKVNAPAGGSFKLKVKTTRRNYDGPITLALTGDAKPLELKNATIPKGKTEIDLEAKLPADLPTTRILFFTVTGTARIGETDRTIPASTAPALRATWPRLASPPPDLDAQIALGVLANNPPTTKPTNSTNSR